MLPNLLLQDHSTDMPSFGNSQGSVPPDPPTNPANSKYAIWTGNGGYFAGMFGGGADFRNDSMMAVKYDTEHEAEQAADKLGMDPEEYQIHQVR